ncbi:MAG: helix-turn-helix domain-containing protein [Ferruginibacter sp.]
MDKKTVLTDNRHPETSLKDAAAKAEYETIMKVLKEVNYNKTKAAQLLNVDRKTLYNKMRSYKTNSAGSSL